MKKSLNYIKKFGVDKTKSKWYFLIAIEYSKTKKMGVILFFVLELSIVISDEKHINRIAPQFTGCFVSHYAARKGCKGAHFFIDLALHCLCYQQS